MYRLALISHLHSLRSEARLTSSLIGRWGRPCGARTSDHAIAPSNGSRHSRWPIHNGRIIHKVALRDKCSRGSSHYPPQHERAPKKQMTIPRDILTNLTETPTWRKADTRTRLAPWGPVTPNNPVLTLNQLSQFVNIVCVNGHCLY